jgi:hypothetical protein
VFGDSFTAFERSAVSWPDLLHDRLEESLGQNVEVVNSARDGYGVLQMFDLSEKKIEEFQPDVVIFAFVTGDLTRSRSWRYEAEFYGQSVGFQSNSILNEPGVSQVATIWNPLLTADWCETNVNSYRPDDPILATLTEQFLQTREKIWKVKFWSVTTSFFLDQINHKDPYYSFRSGERRLKSALTLDIHSFEGDNRFIEAVTNLNESSIPYYLVHLPEFNEVDQGKVLATIQSQNLWNSLEDITGHQVVTFLDGADSNESDPSGLFLMPYDGHPTNEGHRYYADAVFKVLDEAWVTNLSAPGP